VLPPSDFSTLKNFVRKPVHENCSKFFQWFKITNNQLTINDVICDVVFVNNNTATRTTESRRAGARNLMSSQPVFSLSVRSLRSMWWSRLACVFVTRNDSTLLIRALKFGRRRLHSTVARWIRLPARWCASTHSSCHAELALNQLPRFHCQRPVASNFTRLEPFGLPCPGGNVGGPSQAPSETENDRRTERSPAGDLGQPTSGTNRQSCQRVLKATEGLCCSWGWTFRTFTVTAMSRLCYFCLNDVILLNDCLGIFERAKIARWQHCNADNFSTL